MNTILKLKNINLTYHTLKSETHAIKDINLEIYDGEFLSIVGPSGCGKTTILSMISGLLKPTSGEILLENKVVSSVSTNVGYMFQRDNLLPWRSIEKKTIYNFSFISSIILTESSELNLSSIMIDKTIIK